MDAHSEISENDVVELYRLFLEREPENSTVVKGHLETCNSFLVLVKNFLEGHEYQMKISGKRAPVEDWQLLERNRVPTEKLVSEPGLFVNWLGLKTDIQIFNNMSLDGKVFPDLPINGDQVYGGYVEYASLLMAIETAADNTNFAAVELGAGWGPWISAAGVVCRRRGFSDIRLVGVEADVGRFGAMYDHLRRNGLLETPDVKARLMQAAAWRENTVLKFPEIPLVDHGAAVSTDLQDHDYRGYKQTYIDVDAYSLDSICEGLDIVDYMHWDLQGAETEVAMSATKLLNERVRYLFIGTHSRLIEGMLLEFFRENQWDVLSYKACEMSYNRAVPSLAGMTTCDGEFFVRNPRFR